MIFNRLKRFENLPGKALIWGLLTIGIGLLVIRPMGLHLSVMPGTYGDTRLNNYILEHFFPWISGLDIDYWTPNTFIPSP